MTGLIEYYPTKHQISSGCSKYAELALLIMNIDVADSDSVRKVHPHLVISLLFEKVNGKLPIMNFRPSILNKAKCQMVEPSEC